MSQFCGQMRGNVFKIEFWQKFLIIHKYLIKTWISYFIWNISLKLKYIFFLKYSTNCVLSHLSRIYYKLSITFIILHTFCYMVPFQSCAICDHIFYNTYKVENMKYFHITFCRHNFWVNNKTIIVSLVNYITKVLQFWSIFNIESLIQYSMTKFWPTWKEKNFFSINDNIKKNEVVIGSHTDCILQQLVVILTTSNNLIGSQHDYQLNYYL